MVYRVSYLKQCVEIIRVKLVNLKPIIFLQKYLQSINLHKRLNLSKYSKNMIFVLHSIMQMNRLKNNRKLQTSYIRNRRTYNVLIKN